MNKTTNQNEAYTVAPFSGVNYGKNSDKVRDGFTPCAICGRGTDTKKATHWAVVINGGSDWGDERSDQNDPGYMGGWPVGNDCHGKYVNRAR